MFSKMKQLIILFLFISGSSFAQTNQEFFVKTNTFLSTYVKDGLIDYAAIKSNGIIELSDLISQLSNNSYDESIEKAYLINAYNLFVIDAVIENYPTSSPMNIVGFFDAKNSVLNGKLISLNDLENNLLRKKYKDARLHFVLVCGGLGCPPITNFAYTPNQLEQQIELQTKTALNNPKFIYQINSEKIIYLSEIFKWYSTDFGKNKTEKLAFINKYRTEKFNLNYKVKNYPYDWTLNDNHFITTTSTTKDITHQTAPCVAGSENKTTTVGGQTFNAGSLLRKGQMDYTLFNTLYTQTKSNWLGTTSTGSRATFNTHLIQLTYGISKSKRVNLGVDINFKSSGSSIDRTAKGISSAFLYTNTDTSRVGISSVGIRLKLQPFKAVSNFTMQTTLLAPTIKYPEGKSADAFGSGLYWSDWDRITWWNQFYYTKTFGDFQLFTELDFLFRMKAHKNQIGMLDIPMSLFFSYFPTNKITVYAMSQHVPRYTNDINPDTSNDWVIPSNYTASGLGFKYQINRGLNIELLYTNFWRGTNSGLGSTFNFGIKYISK